MTTPKDKRVQLTTEWLTANNILFERASKEHFRIYLPDKTHLADYWHITLTYVIAGNPVYRKENFFTDLQQVILKAYLAYYQNIRPETIMANLRNNHKAHMKEICQEVQAETEEPMTEPDGVPPWD